MGTFVVCIVEHSTKDEHAEELNITRDATKIPSTSLTPENIVAQCRTILTKLRRHEEDSETMNTQKWECPEQHGACVQTMETGVMDKVHKKSGWCFMETLIPARAALGEALTKGNVGHEE